MKRRRLLWSASTVAALALAGAVWWLSGQVTTDEGTDGIPSSTPIAYDEAAHAIGGRRSIERARPALGSEG